MLSATMICAVTTFANSLINYAKESAIYADGNWHVKQLNTDYKSCEDLANNDEIKDSTTLQHIGYAKVDSAFDYKQYIYVAGTQANALDFLPVHISSGKYPTSSSEILLPSHLYTDGAIKYEIGDTITLDIGQRMLNGDVLEQDTSCLADYGKPNGEELVVRESITYTVVGFYDYESYSFESSYAPGFTALTIADSTPSDDYVYDVYARMKDPKTAYEFIDEVPCGVNSNLLMLYGGFSLSSFNIVLYELAAIVIVLIMVGSIALIYNAFSISVSERTKQFGLLSSIGATKQQLRKMVLFEAFAVSAIGIPLGIIVGISGIGITLFAISNMLQTISDMPVDFNLSVSFVSVVAAIVISLLTVLISAWIPSRRATKVSAVEAIRQNNDIKAKNKKLKTSKIIYKLFGMPGVIADKHYKRSKKKYRATVLSLFMSIVLFVSASSFTSYLTQTVDDASNASQFDIYAEIEANQFTTITPEQLYNRIKSAEYVTESTYEKIAMIEMNINTRYLSDEGINKINARYDEEFLPTGDERELHPMLYFVDDATFKALLKQHKLSEKDFMNPEKPQAIAIDGFTTTNYETERKEKNYYLNCDTAEAEGLLHKGLDTDYYQTSEKIEKDGITYYVCQNYDTGKKIEIPEDELYSKDTIKIGYVTDEIPDFASSASDICLVYPMSVCDSVFKEAPHNFTACRYMVNSSNHNESYTALEKILTDNRITNITIYDAIKNEESERNLLLIVNIFANGFIILISLIAIANVFNTISTNVALRRREFAMLKSIGMTKKEMNKMMNFECLLYGSRAILYGLPVSILITLLIHHSVTGGIDMAFRLPWGAIGIAVLSVFIVVFATMIYAMRKIKKENTIDALKNENL